MGGTLYEDSRQKIGHHSVKHEWWSAHGVTVIRKKLDFGDYMAAEGGGNISVDTKQDVQELAGNVGREHARFVREIERANAAGCRLYILVEELERYNDHDEIDRWTSSVCRACRKCDPRVEKCKVKRFKPMNGPTLRKILERLISDHGMRLVFCKRGDSARKICEILGVEYDE